MAIYTLCDLKGLLKFRFVCSGFREWLPGVLPKETIISWDKICNYSSMRLLQYHCFTVSLPLWIALKNLFISCF